MAQLPLLPQPTSATSYGEESTIVLHTGDCVAFCETIPDETVQLVVTSPPYNLGKEYEEEVELEKYLEWLDEVIEQLVRILHPSGSICWQVGNYVSSGEVFPLDIQFYPRFKKHGLTLKNRVVWHFGHGLHATRRFSGRYETLLWFVKGTDYKFNLDPVRIPAKYPGKRSWKGPNRGKPSGNPLGKNPSDVWEFLVEEWESAFWNIPNVKANHPEKTEHPCQFPIELVERCVLAFSDKGDWVFDPFSGVGSTLIAALKNDRRAMGCDLEEKYNLLAGERIQAFYRGDLPIRPLGKPVHRPSGRERVSQRPEEWPERDDPAR